MTDEAAKVEVGKLIFEFEGNFLNAYVDVEGSHLLVGTIAKGAVGRYEEIEKGFVELMCSVVSACLAENGIPMSLVAVSWVADD